MDGDEGPPTCHLFKKLSSSPCLLDDTYGCHRNLTVWVDAPCRAKIKCENGRVVKCGDWKNRRLHSVCSCSSGNLIKFTSAASWISHKRLRYVHGVSYGPIWADSARAPPASRSTGNDTADILRRLRRAARVELIASRLTYSSNFGDPQLRFRTHGDTLPSPPTDAALAATWLPAGSERTHDIRIVLSIITSAATFASRKRRLQQCGDSRIDCLLFTDGPLPDVATVGARVVLPAQYLPAYSMIPLDCCPRAPQSSEMATTRWPATPVHRLGGMDVNSSFFCNGHRNATLLAQARYLPALAYSTRSFASASDGGGPQWLVFVDDDSKVQPQELLSVLARLDSTQALYLGDFGRWTHVRSSRLPGSRRLTWNAPFACGGGGTVLSAAAARRVDFMACAHRFRKTCFQSDWAIGVCLAERRVIPMLNLSCGMCNLLHCSSSKGMEVHALMRLQALTSGCMFAQPTCFGHLINGRVRRARESKSSRARA